MSPGELGIVGTVLVLLALAVIGGGILAYWLLGRRRRGGEVTPDDTSGVSEE